MEGTYEIQCSFPIHGWWRLNILHKSFWLCNGKLVLLPVGQRSGWMQSQMTYCWHIARDWRNWLMRSKRQKDVTSMVAEQSRQKSRLWLETSLETGFDRNRQLYQYQCNRPYSIYRDQLLTTWNYLSDPQPSRLVYYRLVSYQTKLWGCKKYNTNY